MLISKRVFYVHRIIFWYPARDGGILSVRTGYSSRSAVLILVRCAMSLYKDKRSYVMECKHLLTG